MIKIEGEAALMLKPVIENIQERYKLSRGLAVAYCVKAMLLSCDDGNFDYYVDRLYVEHGDVEAVRLK